MASTPTTARMDEFAFKIDHRINKNNKISGRYIFGDDLQSGPPFAGLPAGGGQSADTFNSIAPTRAQMAGLSWTWNDQQQQDFGEPPGVHAVRADHRHQQQD